MPEGVKGGVIANPERVRARAPLLHISAASADFVVILRKDRWRRRRRRYRICIVLKITLARLRVQSGVEYFSEVFGSELYVRAQTFPSLS